MKKSEKIVKLDKKVKKDKIVKENKKVKKEKIVKSNADDLKNKNVQIANDDLIIAKDHNEIKSIRLGFPTAPLLQLNLAC